MTKASDTEPLSGYIFTTAPVQYRGQPSVQLIGKALQALGGLGGATGMADDGPETFTTMGGSARVVNVSDQLNALSVPIVAGIMGAEVGTEAAAINLPYLRLDGTSTMRGHIRAGGHNLDLAQYDPANPATITGRGNIQNANEVVATTVNAPNLTTPNASTPISVARALNMGGNSITGANQVVANQVRAGTGVAGDPWGVVSGGSIWTNGYVDSRGIVSNKYTDGTGGNIYAAGTVNTAGLEVTTDSVVGAACTTGQVGRNASGELLECVSSTWRKPGGFYGTDETDYNGSSEAECGSFSTARECPAGSCMVAFKAWVTSSNITSCSIKCRKFND
jgi:hypothetical protein